MIFHHFSELPRSEWRWPNFSPGELACTCCGEFFLHEDSLDAIQTARNEIAAPLVINSAHRCVIHNARIGGAPLSQHKKIAFDVNLAGHDRMALFEILRQAGFSGFGFYRSFIHADMGRPRNWFGNGAKDQWTF